MRRSARASARRWAFATSRSSSSTQPRSARCRERSSAGRPTRSPASQSGDVETLQRLLDREFEVEGCFLLPGREACARLGIERPAYESARNGCGPLAWDHHWLIIPLHDREGRLVGVIWADEPEDRLLPSTDRLQALRMFANQAATAVAAVAAFEEMQFLAENDALTGVGNRRAFTRRLAEEVHRAARYGQRFALVVLDIDGFKALNDYYGHFEGDMALEAIGEVLRATMRRSDCAFRLGGDEFALILEDAGVQEATSVVDRIGAGIAGVQAGSGHLLRASFGVALADGAPDPEASCRPPTRPCTRPSAPASACASPRPSGV